ncbi:unnamed protein product [Rhizophagus irregularis]|nr:unnamed protein product [Rhizophagus irregularis]
MKPFITLFTPFQNGIEGILCNIISRVIPVICSGILVYWCDLICDFMVFWIETINFNTFDSFDGRSVFG